MSEVVDVIGGSFSAVEVKAGAVLDWPGGQLVVRDVGRRDHSKGYGPCELRAFQRRGALAVGSILNTPWGSAEIVEAPSARRQLAKR